MLVNAGLSDSTDESGNFTITGPLSVLSRARGVEQGGAFLSSGALYVPMSGAEDLTVTVFGPKGNTLAAKGIRSETSGIYRLDLRGILDHPMASGHAFVRARTGTVETTHRIAVVSGHAAEIRTSLAGPAGAPSPLGKRSAVDELLVKKTGFLRKRVPVDSYTESVSEPIALTAPDGDAAHTMRIIYPNGGESFRVGDTVVVEVDADPAKGWRAVLELSWDGGMNWVTIIEEHFATPATVPFAVPDSVQWITEEGGRVVVKNVSPVSDQCMVKAYEYENYDITDVSDGMFTIGDE
jgi:hypothetical protein